MIHNCDTIIECVLHLPVNECLYHFHLLAVMNNPATNIHAPAFLCFVFSFLFGVYLRIKFLHQIITLYKGFK